MSLTLIKYFYHDGEYRKKAGDAHTECQTMNQHMVTTSRLPCVQELIGGTLTQVHLLREYVLEYAGPDTKQLKDRCPKDSGRAVGSAVCRQSRCHNLVDVTRTPDTGDHSPNTTLHCSYYKEDTPS